VVELEILGTGTGRIVPRGGSLLDYVGYLHIFLEDARDGKESEDMDHIGMAWVGRGTRVGKDGVWRVGYLHP